MAKDIELSSLDLRYEGYRMKNPGLEERLLASIAQRGIEEPLEGVQLQEASILLNGFKRYRCARKLQLRSVPYASLGEDEVAGIMNLLRISNNRALRILEQAVFIDELYATGRLSVAEMAKELSRSKSWVSMRLGLISEMSATIRAKLFRGDFPVYSYMYILRQFMRMNGAKGEEVEQFVAAVSGKELSVREIEQLAHGYFREPDSLRQEILNGNLALPLKRLGEASQNPDGCSEFERAMLRDLELTHKYMQRLIGKSRDPRLKSRAFHAQANLLSAAILSRVAAFNQSLKELHDRSGKRKAIFLLHEEGMPLRQIARRLHVSRNTVAVVIAQGGQLPKPVRSPKQKIDVQLLQRLYEQCGGWIQRMHEKLAEEEGIEVKYSTLTRMLRQLGISKSQPSRCSQLPDEPGAEMQHDTTIYSLKLGDQPRRVVATVLYLRYSKRRYLIFTAASTASR